MFELRWIQREIIDELGGFDDIRLRQIKSYEKVLQYRTMTNIEEIGLQPPIWSDWQDVPDLKSNYET